MRLRVEHSTHYSYSRPLQHAIQTFCLTPGSSAHQTVEHWRLLGPGQLFGSVDGYGNHPHTANLPRLTPSGVVRAEGVVRTHPVDSLQDEPSATSPWLYTRPTRLTSHAGFDDFARPVLGAGPLDAASALALAHAVADRVRYAAGHTDVGTSAAQAFTRGKCVCQDQAHVYIAACRSVGLPARYVSGYFHAPDVPELASHAWAEVCIDVAAARWLSVDITHRCLIDERHVRLAVGPDYGHCPPVRGVRSGGGEESMRVTVKVFEQADATV